NPTWKRGPLDRSQHLCIGDEGWNSFFHQDVTLVSSTRFMGGRYGAPPEGAPCPNPGLPSTRCACVMLECLRPSIRGGAGAAVDAVPGALIDRRSDGLGGKAVAMPPRLRRMRSTYSAISGFRR